MANSSDGIRSVERAIDLLQALNLQSTSTLEDLHRHTGLPKPSLVRMLRTFEAKGLVAQSARYGTYYLRSAILSLSSGYYNEPRVVEAAAAVCEAMTRRFKWPVAVAIMEADAVIVRYSTIPHSPLSLLHSSINMRLSLVSRALGRAYLAFCSRKEQDMILDVVARSGRAEDLPAQDRKAARRMLAAIRKQGYALRDPVVRPVSGTIAVPIFEGRQVIASMGLTWFSSVMTPDDAVAKFYPALREAADDVARRMATLSGD